MSEAVTNTEMESVLSSIRRLVGPERETRHPSLNFASTDVSDISEAPKAEKAPALLLAPQFRVNEPEILQLRPEHAVSPDQIALETAKNLDNTETKRHSAQDVRDLIDKITALETAIADTVDEWEPDGAGRDAYAGTPSPTFAWEENATFDAKGSPVDAVRAASQDEAQDDTDFDQILDEEALRQLVAEVVREELQGEIGQRMSRNIRKLIRQEIQRALATEELL